MLIPGSVRPRPPRGKSQATRGVAPLSPFTHRTQRFQPLPPRWASRRTTSTWRRRSRHRHERAREKLVFHVVGDTGASSTRSRSGPSPPP